MMSDKNRITVRLSDKELKEFNKIKAMHGGSITNAFKSLLYQKETLGHKLELTEYQVNFISDYAKEHGCLTSDAVRQILAEGINTLLIEHDLRGR